MLVTATRFRWLPLMAVAGAWLILSTLALPVFRACVADQKASHAAQLVDSNKLNYLRSTAWSVLVRKDCFVLASKIRVRAIADEDRFSALPNVLIVLLASYMWLTKRGPRAMLAQARSNSVIVVTFAMILCFAELFMRVFENFGESFSNVDPLFYFSSFTASRRFGDAFDLQSMSFGQGFGSFQHPTLLNAFWWVFALSDSVQVAYIVTEFAVFVCVLAFALWFSRKPLVSTLSGFLTVVVFFVPRFYADHFGPVMPQHILQIGLCYLALALIGFGTQRRILMAAGALVLAYVAIMDWLYLIFLVPLLGVGLAALCLGLVADGFKTHLVSLVSIFAVVVLFALFVDLSGMKEAYDSFTLMSARAWIAQGVLPDYPRSLLIFGGAVNLRMAHIVGFLSILATLYFAAVGRRHVFFFSMFVLVLVAILVLADLDSTGTGIYWTLPAIGYFERPFIPFYMIVIVFAASRLLEWALARTGLRSLWPAPAAGTWTAFRLGLAVATSCGAAVLLLIPWLRVDFGGISKMVHRPPYFWERAANFLETLPIRKNSGQGFQPYFNDSTKDWWINNCAHLRRDPWDAVAVRYCGLMLNITSVPNFTEFQNLLDLQTTRLFEQATLISGVAASATAGAAFTRLKSLGIRYLAVDGTVAGAAQTRVPAGQPVSLVDLGPIGPEDLSVRSLIFDPVYRWEEVLPARERHVAVVHDQASYRAGLLAPATRFAMTYRPGGVVIQAASDGDSMILLPFQFSHCLKIAKSDRGDIDLVMVDGGQAALRFIRQANVVIVNTLRYFGNVGCRRQDFISVFRLGIWPRNTIDELAQGRRIPFLMRKYLEARFRYRDQIMRSE